MVVPPVRKYHRSKSKGWNDILITVLDDQTGELPLRLFPSSRVASRGAFPPRCLFTSCFHVIPLENFASPTSTRSKDVFR